MPTQFYADDSCNYHMELCARHQAIEAIVEDLRSVEQYANFEDLLSPSPAVEEVLFPQFAPGEYQRSLQLELISPPISPPPTCEQVCTVETDQDTEEEVHTETDEESTDTASEDSSTGSDNSFICDECIGPASTTSGSEGLDGSSCQSMIDDSSISSDGVNYQQFRNEEEQRRWEQNDPFEMMRKSWNK